MCLKKQNFNRVFVIIVGLFCCSFVFAFGSKESEAQTVIADVQNDQTESTDLVTITGHIHVYGSMPHTYLGIVTDDNKVYTILAEKDVLSELQNTQGQTVSLRGMIFFKENDKKIMLFQTLKDGKFKVESWKIVQND